jgi:hypothetical protein
VYCFVGAGSKERKQGIRRLYLKHHPDKNLGDEEESEVRKPFRDVPTLYTSTHAHINTLISAYVYACTKVLP